jgi:hypothetical protein
MCPLVARVSEEWRYILMQVSGCGVPRLLFTHWCVYCETHQCKGVEGNPVTLVCVRACVRLAFQKTVRNVISISCH